MAVPLAGPCWRARFWRSTSRLDSRSLLPRNVDQLGNLTIAQRLSKSLKTKHASWISAALSDIIHMRALSLVQLPAVSGSGDIPAHVHRWTFQRCVRRTDSDRYGTKRRSALLVSIHRRCGLIHDRRIAFGRRRLAQKANTGEPAPTKHRARNSTRPMPQLRPPLRNYMGLAHRDVPKSRLWEQ